MRTLLIDNGSKHIGPLRNMLQKEKLIVTETNYTNINFSIEDFDFVVLSGSSSNNVNRDYNLFSKEVLILASGVPVLGICFGFELICKAFGNNIIFIEKINGVNRIEKTKDHPIFEGINELDVYESHKLGIKSVAAPLVDLAHSTYGVEIIKHELNDIYGFQFHPEKLVNKTNGHMVFHNLIKVLKSKYD